MAFRKGLRRGMAALLCVGMLFSNMELYPVESRAAQQKTVTGSNVSYLKYQRDEVLEVAGNRSSTTEYRFARIR